VFFGLGVAFDMVDDAGVRSEVSALGTRLLDFLRQNSWNVRMPDGRISTTFSIRPDQQLTLLQIGRRINPDRFDTAYSLSRLLTATTVGLPIAAEVIDDHHSYFKFNLNTINFYNLIRLENSSFKRFYDQAYDLMRRTTDGHGNAHFSMIDRALRGADQNRDASTRAQLRDWLLRPRRDPYIDLRGQYPACGEDDACSPITVLDRVRTDFLWQRSPYLLFGGGEGRTEGAGIDYILPYWMGRYYGVISNEPQPPSIVSATSVSGSGSNSTFGFNIWDPNGFADFTHGLIVLNQALAPNNSCFVYYSRPTRSVWLASDGGTWWRGPAPLGSATVLQNSQCSVNAGQSSDLGIGETVMLNLSVSFRAAGGPKNIYFYGQDAAGQATGWQQLGLSGATR
jgi:hypothetical protein